MALGLIWSLICLCGFLILLRLDKMGCLSRENKFPVDGRTILITGGSQGMGRSVGRLLAEKGANVIVVARTVERLKEATAHIAEGAKSKESQRFTWFSADLTNSSECTRVFEAATVWNNGMPPDIVWCCAGSSSPGLFIGKSPEELKQQMDGNYMSSAYMAHAALNAWLKPTTASTPSSFSSESKHAPSTPPASPAASGKQEPRHLIFTASFLALFGITGYSAYTPTKTALRSLADTLSMELLLYPAPAYVPVKTHTVFPATIFTESYEAENRIKPDVTKKLEEGDSGQTAEEVARWSVRGLEEGKELVATTWMTRAVMSSVLGGSKRAGWALLDTLLAWPMAVVMIFVRGDLDAKTKGYGVKYGASGMMKESGSGGLS